MLSNLFIKELKVVLLYSIKTVVSHLKPSDRHGILQSLHGGERYLQLIDGSFPKGCNCVGPVTNTRLNVYFSLCQALWSAVDRHSF